MGQCTHAAHLDTVNNHEQVLELPVGRATPPNLLQSMCIRVRTRCALRRRPLADQRKCKVLQSVEYLRLAMSPPGEPTVCGRSGDALLGHIWAAADKISSRLRVHRRRVQKLLQLWWQIALLWSWDRPLAPTAKRAESAAPAGGPA